MRILYLSGSYVPSRRASSIHVMRMCAALAGEGHEVELVSKRCAARQEPGIEDDFAFYGVDATFRVRKIPRPAYRGGGLRYLWGSQRLIAARAPFDLYYSRDPLAAWVAAHRGLPVIYEAHGPPTGRWSALGHRRLLASPRLRRLVVISAALGERFARLGLRPAHADVVVAHDAAPPLAIEPPAPLAGRPPRLGYVGHLYAGRGIRLFIDLAGRLPDCELHLIGGSEADLGRWRRRRLPSNLRLHGFVPPARLLELYREFDVLLMPYQRRVGVAGGRSDTAAWMSPMKLFEYMATGRPIIASDLPVLREVLAHEENALLAPPDASEAWAAAVARLVAEPGLGRRLGATARRQQRDRYTWTARARRVLEGLPDGPG